MGRWLVFRAAWLIGRGLHAAVEDSFPVTSFVILVSDLII